MLWARRAAEKGNNEGMHIVGYLIANGNGVPRDRSAASAWFARAAAKGHEVAKEALRNLAGAGVAKAACALRRLGLDGPPASAAGGDGRNRGAAQLAPGGAP